MFSDQELVARCNQGSQDAFRLLVDRHWASVVRTVSSLLGDPDDVEDAAQEAFILACRRLDDLKDPVKLPAWLHTIALNAARKALRQKRLERERLPEYELRNELPASDLQARLDYRGLKVLVNSLAPPDLPRGGFRLYGVGEQHGLPGREVPSSALNAARNPG